MSATLKKNSNGYNYNYTDLAGIHQYLEQEGLSYYQYINVLPNGDEQVMTVRSDKDEPIPGDIIQVAVLKDNKNNPAQAHGAALTYARRYSLLMAYGLATSDDDAECLTINSSMLAEADKPITEIEKKTFLQRCKRDGVDYRDIGKQAGARDLKTMTAEQMGKALIILGEIEEAVNE